MECSKYKLSALALLACVSTNALAGGFQLSREFNAVEIGNGGSGGAAIVSDASTAWSNPAGLSKFDNAQVVVSADGIFSYAKFKGTNTWISTANPATRTTPQSGSAVSDVEVLVPAIYLAVPIKDNWSAGLSVNAPYGLVTDYDFNSVIRYSATKSKFTSIDISPNLAYKFNEHFSLGAGIDFVRMYLEFRRVVGSPLTSTTLDSLGKNTLDNWGYGAHAGILYEYTPETRVGLTYHSLVSSTLEGTSTLQGPITSGVQNSNDNLRARFVLPPSTVLSLQHMFNKMWTLNASAYYTEWSRVNAITTSYNLAGLTATAPVASASIAQFFRNTWTLALGGSYAPNDKYSFRAGVSYDQTPTKNAYRNPTLPDGDRVTISLGMHLNATKRVSFDAGWMHLFIHDVNVSAPLVLGSQTSLSDGSYRDSSVDVVGVQMNYNFV